MRLELLWGSDSVVFTTREYALQAKTEMSTASRQLRRAEEAGAIARITRGLWANTQHPHFHPLVCVSRILGNEQGHVSFLTALHLHDVISQIPRTIQVATTGRGRRLDTPVATFELFRLSPTLMGDGIEWSDTQVSYRLASAERALFDTLYLSTRKLRRFRSLPELELGGRRFSRPKFRRLLGDMSNARLASAVRARATELGVLP